MYSSARGAENVAVVTKSVRRVCGPRAQGERDDSLELRAIRSERDAEESSTDQEERDGKVHVERWLLRSVGSSCARVKSKRERNEKTGTFLVPFDGKRDAPKSPKAASSDLSQESQTSDQYDQFHCRLHEKEDAPKPADSKLFHQS